VPRCVVVSGVHQESHRTIEHWDRVGVSYNGVRGLVVAVRACVCSTIIPKGIWGRTRVWHRKTMRGMGGPLPEHVGHSLLRPPKCRSRTLDGCLVVKVVHWLG
jgi:hypothetical protein